jgi:hypothetical protein
MHKSGNRCETEFSALCRYQVQIKEGQLSEEEERQRQRFAGSEVIRTAEGWFLETVGPLGAGESQQRRGPFLTKQAALEWWFGKGAPEGDGEGNNS